ncbi:MAG: 16S rRNA (cytidine(1402)-2'-O)-methyltransferase [Eubacteriales bacterium]|nr:16S rRNA (cytidine(1402)-2'-O)-methyltransferase [Eubacteriales bacterium]
MNVLYVVATPIGNLGDLSPRALQTLRDATLILAEDTRVTRKLLSAADIRTPVESCHEHNEAAKARQIAERMAAEEMTIALVTDAGTPAVSDPGARVVQAVSEAGFSVLAVPGPCAFAAALSVSGFDEKEFTFFGFLPRKKGELREKLKGLKGQAKLAVFYEAPHRIMDLLSAIAQEYPRASLSVSRELSKIHEQTLRGTAREVAERFEHDESIRRGEFCLVLKLPDGEETEPSAKTGVGLEARLVDLMAGGMSLREAMDTLTGLGEKKNAVYAASLKLKRLAGKF